MNPKNITQCIANDQLYAYLVGELSPERGIIVESHLASCDDCLSRLNSDELIMFSEETTAESAVLDNIYQQTFANSLELWPTAIMSVNSSSGINEEVNLPKPNTVRNANLSEANLVAQVIPFPAKTPTKVSQSNAPNTAWGHRSIRGAAIAALLLICFTATVFWYRSALNSDPIANPIVQAQSMLQQSPSLRRPTEFRLAAASYAPYHKERGAQPVEVQRTQLKSVQAALQALVETDPQAATQQLLAQVALNTGDVDIAIEQLLKVSTPSRHVYNDLAIAYMERGQATLALQYLTQALNQDPRYLEALFNRALLHQQLRRTIAARQDWQAYLALDSASDWATEARNYLKQLDR